MQTRCRRDFDRNHSMPISFRAHGQFDIFVDGRIVITEVEGPWNRELVFSWASRMLELCGPLAATGPYVAIAVVRGSILCPPDALDSLRTAVAYGAARLNCIGNVIVADAAVEGRTLMRETYETLFEDSTPHRYCDDLGEAKAWAVQLLSAKGY